MKAGFENRRAGWVVLLVTVLLCIVVAEVAVRAIWLRRGVPLSAPDKILWAYYPALAEIAADPPTRDDGTLDLLILAGSVPHHKHGSVENELLEQLSASGRDDVRIFNLATPAHTTRDSRIKYEALHGASFDLVIFYHGINESRTNNAPPDLFMDDYSHYAWYETVNAMIPYHDAASFALPYTLRLVALRVKQSISSDRHVPIHEPRPEWLAYGGDLRSAAAFEDNLRTILDLADRRGDAVLLMTFATRVPENYSKEAFDAERLDYVRHRFPLEFWGQAEHVMAAVAAHNDVVRRLAADRDNGLFVDQAALMGDDPREFDDPCHLTAPGSAQFVRNMLPAVLSIADAD